MATNPFEPQTFEEDSLTGFKRRRQGISMKADGEEGTIVVHFYEWAEINGNELPGTRVERSYSLRGDAYEAWVAQLGGVIVDAINQQLVKSVPGV